MVELVDDAERGKEREERRARRSDGSESSRGEPKAFSEGDQRHFSRRETKPFSEGEPRQISEGEPRQISGREPRPAPKHTLALLLTLADLPLSDNCLASLLCRVADHPLLGDVPRENTLEDGDMGRNCGGRKCGIFLF